MTGSSVKGGNETGAKLLARVARVDVIRSARPARVLPETAALVPMEAQTPKDIGGGAVGTFGEVQPNPAANDFRQFILLRQLTLQHFQDCLCWQFPVGIVSRESATFRNRARWPNTRRCCRFFFEHCCLHSFFFGTAVRHPAVCCSLHWAGDSQPCAPAHTNPGERKNRDSGGKGKRDTAGAVFDVTSNCRLGVGRVSSKRQGDGEGEKGDDRQPLQIFLLGYPRLEQ